MLPCVCFGFDKCVTRKKKDERRIVPSAMDVRDLQHYPVLYNRNQTRFPLQSVLRDRSEQINESKTKMANKVSNISDLIHRVASSCLTHRLPSARGLDNGEETEIEDDDGEINDPRGSEAEEEDEGLRIWEEEKGGGGAAGLERVREMEALMGQIFETVSAMKRAYVSLQEAHCPWDPDKMRVADAAVVAELRKVGRLRDRFRRGGGGRVGSLVSVTPLREAVAPYEAALDDMKKELKSKEAEVESLKEKLRSSVMLGASGRKGRHHFSKRVGCITGVGAQGRPTAELFEACMEEVKSSSKSFTSHLLSLMRSARWDISAAVRSIVNSTTTDGRRGDIASLEIHHNYPSIPDVGPKHAKHALESYVNRRLFHGFENETFYIDGSLSSLLHPDEFRRDCFVQFRDMRGMDPAELLGILPTCQFGKFAAKKYLAVVHAKMEESLFGGMEQHRQVVAGTHPRTGFYGEFLRLAKAMWLLHLLAFALDPAPSHFEASKGAEFHPDYMESVVRFGGGRVPPELVVGFSVAPGFKLGNGSVVRARVYLVPRGRGQ
ncbi:protein GRAVITROPIC IN THE LIGHT 1 isoform X1 [Typha latifolia]|uniref:protein GRAVITROPIC IN THE LIGHT 1 isoform X1 n=1 Tax=Typha latifolia TaxID=4733 RepID=UPI003C2DE65F